MTEPKTAPKRKSSTSLRSSIPLLELSVTVQTGRKQKKRLFIFPSSSLLLLEAPDAHALGHGDISAQQHEDSKCPWDDFKMQTSIHGHNAASNKQFLHQSLYHGILSRNHRKIFELKQGSFLCPQYLRSGCQNTSHLPSILIQFGFNGSLTLFASTLHSQKTKSHVASSHMQIHLTTLSLVQRRDIYPGLFVEVTLLPPSPQHVHQPLAACDPHLSFGAPPDISGSCFDPDHTPRAAPASCSSSSPSQQGTGMPCSVEGKGTALSCPRDPLSSNSCSPSFLRNK